MQVRRGKDAPVVSNDIPLRRHCGCGASGSDRQEVAKYRRVLDGVPSMPAEHLSRRDADAGRGDGDGQRPQRATRHFRRELRPGLDREGPRGLELPAAGGHYSHVPQGGQRQLPVYWRDSVLGLVSAARHGRAAEHPHEPLQRLPGRRGCPSLRRRRGRKALLLDMQSVILVEVAQVYYQILRSEKLADVLTTSVAVQQDRVTDLENKLSAGTVAAVDVSQARALAANTRAHLWPRGPMPKMAGPCWPSSPAPTKSEAAWWMNSFRAAAAVGGRPGQSGRAEAAGPGGGRGGRRRAKAVVLQQALGEYAPLVTLNITSYLYRQSFPTRASGTRADGEYSDLHTAGQIESNVREAWSQLRQAALRARLIERADLQDVRIAYENVRLADNTLTELRTQVQAADDAYRQAGDAFHAGVATSLEQLIAQDQLLTAQVQLNSQEFNYKAAYLSLLRVSGQLRMQANKVQAVEMATRRPASEPASPPTTQAVARLIRRPAQ